MLPGPGGSKRSPLTIAGGVAVLVVPGGPANLLVRAAPGSALSSDPVWPHHEGSHDPGELPRTGADGLEAAHCAPERHSAGHNPVGSGSAQVREREGTADAVQSVTTPERRRRTRPAKPYTEE